MGFGKGTPRDYLTAEFPARFQPLGTAC